PDLQRARSEAPAHVRSHARLGRGPRTARTTIRNRRTDTTTPRSRGGQSRPAHSARRLSRPLHLQAFLVPRRGLYAQRPADAWRRRAHPAIAGRIRRTPTARRLLPL